MSTVIALVGLLGLSGVAQDGQRRPSVDELLHKIRLLEERVDELETEQAADPADELETRINALEESVATLGGNDFRSFWKSTTNFETEDQAFKIKVGGRIQIDWVFGTQDDDLRETINVSEGKDPVFQDGVEFRRARIFIAGQLHEHVVFKAQYDFVGGDVDFKDVYLGFRKVPLVQNVRIGHFKQPFSLEELTSSKYITFLERALPNVFSQSRENGIMVFGSVLEDDRLTYALSVFRDVDDTGDSPKEDGKYNVAARLTGLPWYAEEGARFLHVGIGAVYNNPNGDTVRFRQRPEIHLSQRFLDTGSFEADDVIRLNFELAFVYDSFSAQGEFFYVAVDSDSVNDPDFWGFYFYLSYFLTGEHRRYKNKSAAFDRTKPHHNVYEDGAGAWEIAARISMIDLDDVNAGDELNFTFGINWYLNPNTRISLNYVFAAVDDLSKGAGDGEAHIVGIRFQIDF